MIRTPFWLVAKNPPAHHVLGLLVGCGLALRVLAAVMVQRTLAGQVPPRLCIFPDANIYWLLARALRIGATYEVSQWGVPHYALRTPGYPLFLAACQGLFGENPLAVRLIQAGLGAGCIWLAYRLFRCVFHDSKGPSMALVGAAFLTLDPYAAAMSVLLLSEALFIPLMLLALWGIAALWPATDEGARAGKTRPILALATGMAVGSAILVRPSWTVVVPVLLVAWVISSPPWRSSPAWRSALLVCFGAALLMAPWWVRNARVYGRFVPTALWVGPSLYDGLNPQATGASDMAFLDDPDVRRLDEVSLESDLRARAWAFARAHPGRALELAVVKSGRFWCPWPNAEQLWSPRLAVASALVTLPVFGLVLLGAWQCRRDLRALVLLAGTLVGFWVLHALFVGSVRYRIPGMVPALGLAALGTRQLWDWWGGRSREPSRVGPV